MEYAEAAGVVAAALTANVLVDTAVGYFIARKLLKEGYTRRGCEEQVRFRAPDFIEFKSRPGRWLAYWLHVK